ncbi:MAG: hypothetical protein PHV77_07385 [Candidatus Omnitrophica bacterium]|nr:hypothetical protein [Candidatus Omnitrophota bacterium]
MGSAEKAALTRIGRSIVDVAITGGIQYATDSSWSVVALPVIAGIGKWLRTKFNLSWLPF